MFSWDGMQDRFFLADDIMVPCTNIGMYLVDDAPPEWENSRFLPPGHDDLRLVTGWEAVIPLGENGAVVEFCAYGENLTACSGQLRVSLGPDPYAIGGPECTVVDEEIQHVKSTDGDERLIQVLFGWHQQVNTGIELFSWLARLSAMSVRR